MNVSIDPANAVANFNFMLHFMLHFMLILCYIVNRIISIYRSNIKMKQIAKSTNGFILIRRMELFDKTISKPCEGLGKVKICTFI